MSTPARTPAAGLPHPAWPTRPTPPTVPGHADRAAPAPRPSSSPPPGWPAGAPTVRPLVQHPVPTRPATPEPVVPPAPAALAAAAPVVPPEEQTLDPRSIARASLAARRNRSLWMTSSGIVAAVAVSFLVSAVAGTYVLALLLLVSAVVRAVRPAPGPVAVSVRSKPLDVAVLALNGVVLAVLASLLPPG